jgi:hypothetical protein
VTLEDRNEFHPTFTLATYTKTIAEDLAPGSSILTGKFTSILRPQNKILFDFSVYLDLPTHQITASVG